MSEKRQFFHIFLILLISSSTFSERNFDIIFDDIKCTTDNKDYVKYHSCSVDKSGDIPVLNVDIQMQKEVQEFRLDFAVYALTAMKKKFTAYKVNGVNYCDLQAEETVIAPIFKSFYDMLQRAGTLPSSCPIPAINSNLVFDDITCVVENKDYIESCSCSVDKSGKAPLLNMDIQMKKEVQESRYDVVTYAIAANSIPIRIFKADGLDHCDLQSKENIIPAIKMVHEMLHEAGYLPNGCPIPADFHYTFKNISINNDLLPMFARNMGFKIILVHNNGKTKLITITIAGKVVP
ncbi:uncharacterized protein LOC129919327 [Episyrphus balteatus]|uniref:uncharacterized protein LOC129919327 n=1 Tax=Episyrphus balteatus TaxID=286459 RepID=UPI00248523A3|nr:uncharacterized protein LOC129919327 [Episyrphus balteatus]